MTMLEFEYARVAMGERKRSLARTYRDYRPARLGLFRRLVAKLTNRKGN